MKKQPLGFYNYTVILTYIGMVAGFLGITCVLDNNIPLALVCLMISGICDMFDGAVASTMERTQDERFFGIQIDSFSDLICFGVLPAIVVYRISENTKFAFGVTALFVLCSLIRLAYFNVDEQNRQLESSGGREIYLGLPVTTVALILPLLFLIGNKVPAKLSTICDVSLIVIAILFLYPFKLKKPKFIGKIAMAICGGIVFVMLLMGLGTV